MTNTPTNQIEASKEQEEVRNETLTPYEVQTVRALMEKEVKGRIESFSIPPLEISEQDKDNFATNLLEGNPYCESFDKYKGKLKISFRSKLKWEEDMLIEQIRKDFEDKKIETSGQYMNRVNCYNLCFQLTELDGVPSKKITKSTDLRSFLDNSIFESMPEPKLYILISLMTQFESKVSKLCHLSMLDFSAPGSDS